MEGTKNPTNRRATLRLLAAGGIGAVAAPLLAAPAFSPSLAWAEDSREKSGRDALAVMHSRRSHRSYTGAAIPDEDLDRILAAAMQAPSAHDSRPWEFVILRNRETVRRIVTLIPSLIYIEKAAALILNCMNTRADATEPPEINLMSMSCCAHTELLAAEALGYGAVWIGLMHEGDRAGIFKRLLGLPEQCQAFNMVAVGVPSMQIPREDRFDPKRIHLDKWSG
jgi:nitroreductase